MWKNMFWVFVFSSESQNHLWNGSHGTFVIGLRGTGVDGSTSSFFAFTIFSQSDRKSVTQLQVESAMLNWEILKVSSSCWVEEVRLGWETWFGDGSHNGRYVEDCPMVFQSNSELMQVIFNALLALLYVRSCFGLFVWVFLLHYISNAVSLL